jgi:phosphinothricin acetyltransferase
VAEVSIYVAAAYRGQGLGGRLLAALAQESEAHGIWTLQAGIFAGNSASIMLHQRAGFRLVGRRERIGRRGGQWHDTVLMERRSEVVGL